MKTLAIPALAMFCLALSPFANAQCGAPSAASRVRAANLPWPPVPALEAKARVSAASAESPDEPTIVGLWDVTFIANGQLYDEAFDQYHADGTEIMNDIPPPATGNVCLGVWAKTGSKSYKLRHPFWIFDPNGNLIGRGVLHEELTLNGRGDAYSGTFTFAFRDLTGHTIPGMPDVWGRLTATRITAD